MFQLGYTNHTVPGPHATFRQQYRFPQAGATPFGYGPRPTRKGAGSQLTYIGYEGGPQAAPTQLKWLTGLGSFSGLGALTWSRMPTTYGALRARARGVVALLRESAGELVTVADVNGVRRTMPAAEFAGWLETEVLSGTEPDAQALPSDAGATIAAMNEAEQQVLPWYRTRTFGSVLGVLSLVSTGASAYHGYRRNKSIGWAVWWGLMGGIFPIITPAIAVAQGFGKRKR